MAREGTSLSMFRRVPELTYVTTQVINSRRIQRPIHQHGDLTELLFVYRGEGFYVCDGYTYPIRPGDFLLYNQGGMHEVQSASELEIGTCCFGMTGLELEGLAPGWMTDPAQGFVRPAQDRFGQIEQICQTVFDLMLRNEPYERAAAQQLFLGLLLLALGTEPDERCAHTDENAAIAARIRQYITLHYTEPLTLQSVAEALHISPYYASHVFREKIGVSPMRYMTNCRIGEAQNLLIASDYSATRIGAMVGYDSIHHFNAIFKKYVGLPPIQYRKHYLESMRGARRQ